MKIHILKHDQVDQAEQELSDILNSRGHQVDIIDPTKGSNFDIPKIVVSRCELDNLFNKVAQSYFDYLDFMKSRNVEIINQKKFIITGQDKYKSHQAVASLGINPETKVASSVLQGTLIGKNMLRRWRKIVIKPRYGARGDGIYFVHNKQGLKNALDISFKSLDSVLLQQFIKKETEPGHGCRDIRVWVCRNAKTNKPEFITACHRIAPTGKLLTNLCQGGSIKKIANPDSKLIDYSCRVLELTGGDVAGIDFTRDQNGRLWFEEINISFDTGKKFLDLLGNDIWHRVADLVETKIKLAEISTS